MSRSATESGFFDQSAAQIVDKIDQDLTKGLRTSAFTAQEKLALACRILAQSIGTIRAVAPELAQQAHDFLLKDSVVNATFEYWARQIVRKDPAVLKT